MRTEYRANEALTETSAREQARREWAGRQGRYGDNPATDDEERAFRWVAITIAAFWAACFIVAVAA